MKDSKLNIQDSIDKVSGLRARIKKWVLSGISLARDIPRDLVGRTFVDQLIRAMTSVGANYEEASETQTPKDLVYKLVIVIKEAKESRYWLDLVNETYPSLQDRCKVLLQEAGELIRIFSSIISKKKKLL